MMLYDDYDDYHDYDFADYHDVERHQTIRYHFYQEQEHLEGEQKI